MSAGPQRDEALTRVARDAVDEGESQVAHVALQAIDDAKVRDKAAARCAREIADNEGVEAALPVARMIRDDARRDDVLRKLSEA
jgi:hypothetical protein